MIAVVSYAAYRVIDESLVLGMIEVALNALDSAEHPLPCTLVKGRKRQCWRTVRKVVRKHGGRAVSGWSVMDIDPRLPQSNPLARTVLNAHCVWEGQDKLLYETLPERYGLGFIRADVPTPNAIVEFFDDVWSVRRANLPQLNWECVPYLHLGFSLKQVRID